MDKLDDITQYQVLMIKRSAAINAGYSRRTARRLRIHCIACQRPFRELSSGEIRIYRVGRLTPSCVTSALKLKPNSGCPAIQLMSSTIRQCQSVRKQNGNDTLDSKTTITCSCCHCAFCVDLNSREGEREIKRHRYQTPREPTSG